MNGMHKENTTQHPNDHHGTSQHVAKSTTKFMTYQIVTHQIMKCCPTSLNLGIEKCA